MNLMNFKFYIFENIIYKFYLESWQQFYNQINDKFVLDILNLYLIKKISYLIMIIISCNFTNKI
jgi:hypothetical protein